jgi:hypothetical protein
MSFIEHTINWTKGEIFEGTIISISGFIFLLSGLAFWKMGTTPHAKTMIVPALIIGILMASVGLSMYFSNQKRITDYQKQYLDNPTSFIQQEKKRVEDFQYMYVISKVLATVAFVFAIFAFWFTKSPIMQSISMALLTLGLSSLIIDYFSEERATIYYEFILKNI